jgi:hypothetical protein
MKDILSVILCAAAAGVTVESLKKLKNHHAEYFNLIVELLSDIDPEAVDNMVP